MTQTQIFDSIASVDGQFIRRRFLKTFAAAGALAGTCGLRNLMAQQAEELRRHGKSMILLWMQGGPSQFEPRARLRSTYHGDLAAMLAQDFLTGGQSDPGPSGTF